MPAGVGPLHACVPVCACVKERGGEDEEHREIEERKPEAGRPREKEVRTEREIKKGESERQNKLSCTRECSYLACVPFLGGQADMTLLPKQGPMGVCKLTPGAT